jgi:hypothetical protein
LSGSLYFNQRTRKYGFCASGSILGGAGVDLGVSRGSTSAPDCGGAGFTASAGGSLGKLVDLSGSISLSKNGAGGTDVGASGGIAVLGDDLTKPSANGQGSDKLGAAIAAGFETQLFDPVECGRLD